jgi:hypothetical protein
MRNLDENIQSWFIENQPDDQMRYKEAWWNNNLLIRDRLLKLFPHYYAEVVGTHCSKSIKCPVIKTGYKGVEIIWQYNFHDWQIMIKSPVDLELHDLELYKADGTYFYYQGIPEDYKFDRYSKTNKKQFAIDISGDRFDVWGFALELRKAIDFAETIAFKFKEI